MIQFENLIVVEAVDASIFLCGIFFFLGKTKFDPKNAIDKFFIVAENKKMEFNFYISKVIDVDDDGFATLDSYKMPHMNDAVQAYHNNFRAAPPVKNESYMCIREIINRMGEASAKVLFSTKNSIIVSRS